MKNRFGSAALLAGLVAAAACNEQSEKAESVRAAQTTTQPAEGLHGVGDIGAGVQDLPSSGVSKTLSQSDLNVLAGMKRRIAPSQPAVAASSVGPTAETLSWASKKSPDEIVTFVLLLSDPAFDGAGFRSADVPTRAAMIEQRKTDLVPLQKPVIAKLTALGGNKILPLWLTNGIYVQLPARFASTLAAWPEVEKLEHTAPLRLAGTPVMGDGYYGADRRAVVHADRLIGHGFNGHSGNAASPTSPVRLGAIGLNSDGANADSIPPNHPGFETASTLVTRFYMNDDCSGTSQTCYSDSAPTAQTHETVVMSVMAGSIEGGQDSHFPGTSTADQIDRSGIASMAQLEYFRSGENDTDPMRAVAIALHGAIAAGVDVVNMSLGLAPPGWTTTDPSTDLGGLNEMIHSAFSTYGVLIVTSAGDSNDDTFTQTPPYNPTCNLDYPSNRPEVLSVNGMNTTYQSGGSKPTNPELLRDAWATSGCTIDVYDGYGNYYPHNDNAIGIVAPGRVSFAYTTNSYNPSGITWLGSSFSAPVVAGAAGLIRDAWRSHGYGIRANTYLKTDLLMLTDGYDFTTYGDGGTGRNVGGTSQFSGLGRLVLRTPIDDFPHGGWNWTWGSVSISSGTDWTKTVPANIQNYRFAMFWVESDLTHAADIDVRVDALDQNGNECQTFVASQADYSIINAVHIKRSDIPSCALPNGKLQLHIMAYAIPPSQSRTVYMSDLYDSETSY